MNVVIQSVTEPMAIRMQAMRQDGVGHICFGLSREAEFFQLALPFRTGDADKATALAKTVADAYVAAGWRLNFFSNIEDGLANANLILPFA